MRLLLAFLAGSALVGGAVFVAMSSDASDDAPATEPLRAAVTNADRRADMELQPVEPRAEDHTAPAVQPLAVEPVEAPVAVVHGESALPAGLDAEAFDAAVEAALERKLEERERAEREAREEREEQFLRDRARAIAEEVGLGQSDELALAELMLATNGKRDALREELRNGAMPFEERTNLRERFEEIERAHETGLQDTFGPSLAEEIQDAARDGWRGGWGRGRRGDDR